MGTPKGTARLSRINEDVVEALSTPVPVARGRIGLAAICCAVMLLYSVYLGALGVLLPFLGKTFGLGASVQGRLYPATFTGFVAGVLICGSLSDLWGRKRVLLLGITTYAAGIAFFGVSASFNLALLASLLVGAGSGAMEAAASALASDLYPERRAFLINAIQVAFGAGATFSPSLAHFLLTHGTDWRTLYLVLAAANVGLLLVLAAQKVPRNPQSHEAVDFAALVMVLRRPVVGALCLAQLLYVGAETGFFSWMPTYFEKALPNGERWAGLVVSVFWAALTAGRVASGWLLGRLPLLRLTFLLAVGSVLFSALSLLWKSPPLVMIFTALTGLMFSGIFGFILAEGGERFHAVAGTVFGAIVAAGGVGAAIFPWLIGELATTSLGWRGALVTVPIIAAGIAAIALWLQRQQQAEAVLGV